MILEQISALDVSGIEGVSEYTIGHSPIIFELLATHMYTDKEKACLYEVASNALDAHAMAGKEDVPISIQLPTQLSPELVIQDYGIGMSEQEILDNYFGVGATTKRTSEKEVGGFGIGKMTPFALSESFTIQTTKDGITTEAFGVRQRGDFPKFAITSVGNQGLEDGTIVKVPVTDSTSQFQLGQAVNRVFLLWPTQPIVDEKQLEKPEIIESSDFVVVEGSVLKNPVYVAVGPSLYQIPEAMITKLKTSKATDKLLNYFFNWRYSGKIKLIVKFGLNEIAVAGNRDFIEDLNENFDKLCDKLSVFGDYLNVDDLAAKIIESTPPTSQDVNETLFGGKLSKAVIIDNPNFIAESAAAILDVGDKAVSKVLGEYYADIGINFYKNQFPSLEGVNVGYTSDLQHHFAQILDVLGLKAYDNNGSNLSTRYLSSFTQKYFCVIDKLNITNYRKKTRKQVYDLDLEEDVVLIRKPKSLTKEEMEKGLEGLCKILERPIEFIDEDKFVEVANLNKPDPSTRKKKKKQPPAHSLSYYTVNSDAVSEFVDEILWVDFLEIAKGKKVFLTGAFNWGRTICTLLYQEKAEDILLIEFRSSGRESEFLDKYGKVLNVYTYTNLLRIKLYKKDVEEYLFYRYVQEALASYYGSSVANTVATRLLNRKDVPTTVRIDLWSVSSKLRITGLLADIPPEIKANIVADSVLIAHNLPPKFTTQKNVSEIKRTIREALNDFSSKNHYGLNLNGPFK